jgi:hypothetical protein
MRVIRGLGKIMVVIMIRSRFDEETGSFLFTFYRQALKIIFAD